jgi:MFS family permease
MPKRRAQRKAGRHTAPRRSHSIYLREHTGLLTSAAYVLCVAAVGLKYHLMGDGQSEADFLGSYVSQASSFLHGSVAIDPYRGPVYPIVLALLYLPLKIFGAGLFETGIVLSALSAGIVLYCTYKLVEEVFSFETGLVVLGLLITNRIFIRYSYTTGNDMFFTALAAASAYLFLADRTRRGWLWAVAVGLITGLVYLTRYNGIAILLAVVIGTILVNPWRWAWRRRMTSALAITGTFVIVILPWGIHCKSETGRFLYNQNYENIAYGFYLESGYADRFMKEHAGEFDSFTDVVRYDPGVFLRAIPGRTVGYLAKIGRQVLGWPIGIVVLCGVILLFVRRPDRTQFAYFLYGVLFFSVLILVFFAERFVLFLLPVLFVAGVEGVKRGMHTVLPRGRRRVALVVFSVLLIGYSSSAAYAYNKTYLRGGSMTFRRLGEWFANTIPPGERGRIVAARKPHFGYFAGLKTIPIPVVDSYDELLGYLKRQGADYLFFSPVAAQMREELAFLARVRSPEQAPRGLKLMASTSAGVLYQVQ